MSLFSGYHFIGDDTADPPAPAGLSLPPGDGSTPAGPRPPAPPDRPGEDLRLERTLTELRSQLAAEAAVNRRSREALLGLANLVCQAALEAERRSHGDAGFNAWSAVELCQFITDQLRPLAAALRPGTPDGLLTEYLKLAERHQTLQRRYDAHQALLDRQADGPAPAGAAGPVEAGPSAEAHGAVAVPASANAERITDLVKVMAETGLARYSKLRERLATQWGLDLRSGSIKTALDAAAAQELVRLYETKSDWQGSATVLFVELTRSGLDRARSAGATPVRNELADGLEAGYTLPQINLILRAVDLLRAAGYRQPAAFPTGLSLPEAPEYAPVVAAVDEDGQRIFVECERERATADRTDRWVRAARAGLGCLHLLTTAPGLQEALVSEINMVRMTHTFRLRAANVVDVLKRKPATPAGLWSYDR